MFKKKHPIIIIVIVLLGALSIGISLQVTSTTKEETNHTASALDHPPRRGETRPVLSPSEFSDPSVAEAYQIAKDIPHVLDSLKCYCLCDMTLFKRKNKSLLSCYVDTHATT